MTEEDGVYRMSWEQGPFGVIKEYEISKENFEKAMKSAEDAYEVSVYAATGSWPSSEEEKLEEARNLIRKLPGLLLKNPDNQKLFSQEELEELMKKAKGKDTNTHLS
ncbi:MAG: hypothetical protein K6F23_03460 [Solobacterium sp.]|nr:hypothetical protein [Solobacterium sp.]